VTDEVPSRNESPALYSPLHRYHLDRGAKMADFGGWLMPIEYPPHPESSTAAGGGGVLAEHAAVRERVGIFDVSHLGKISVKGEGALEVLNTILTNDLNSIADTQAQYTMLCDENGGVIDDMIAYRVSSREIFLIPNASNCTKVFQVIAAKTPEGIEVKNQHHDFGIIAVQGPDSREMLAAIGLEIPTTLDYMSFLRLPFQSSEIIVCRTGYTGERGYELVVPVNSSSGDHLTVRVWDLLVASLPQFNGLVAGLGARDTLRTEMGYALHGHELSLEINPLEAGVGWAVSLAKPSWLGRSALEKFKENGLQRRSVALVAKDRTIPRAGMAVTLGGEQVGVVTSGTFSPSIKKGIALALVRADIAKGSSVTIDVRGRLGEYEVVRVPFVPSHVR
jgi:aminomethyltransferase